MQKSYLPLLISATVCGTLLADVSISGNVDMDYSSGSDQGDTPDVSISGNSMDFSTGSSDDDDPGRDGGFALSFTTESDQMNENLFSSHPGFTISGRMETLNNEFTTANNRATLALAYGGVLGFADTGMQPAAYYSVSGSHRRYDEGLPDQNTLAAKIGLAIPFGGTAVHYTSGYAMTLGVTALTADHFLDAGNTYNVTVDAGYSMPVMDGLTLGAGIKAGHTETDNGGNTDLVGVDSFNYSEMKVGVKYVTGDLTFNVAMSRTDTSEQVGAVSTDRFDTTSASVSYAVASGVTAILGYTRLPTENGVGETDTDDGSAWYMGANMSF